MGGRRSAVTDRQVIAASAQGTAAAMRALDWNVAEAMKLLYAGEGLIAVLRAVCIT